MKICKYCNSPADDSTGICPNCGASDFDSRCGQCGTVFSTPCCPQCGLPAGTRERRCQNCGTRYFSNACPSCGYMAGPLRYTPVPQPQATVSPKSRTIALILCFFLGIYGAHRFYTGKIGSGILYICTVGVFGIGWIVDLILILSGAFKDKNGLPLAQW